MFRKVLIIIIVGVTAQSQAQQLTRQQVKDTIQDMPVFSMYEDNYFITGVPLNQEINKKTADAKYQVSFRYLLNRNTLPWNSYLFLTYTQKSFWDIYDKSHPFKEINFKPGLSLGFPVFNKNKLLGMAFLKAEHESNGRDSIYSRSWNKISVAFHADLGERSTLSAEAWFPFAYKKYNPQLPEYIGLGEVNFSYELQPDQWTVDMMLRKGLNWDFKGAFRTRLLYSPFKMDRISLMLEWYYGYAESLIAFDELRNKIRIGLMIRSDDLNFL